MERTVSDPVCEFDPAIDEAAEAIRRRAGKEPRPVVVVAGSGLAPVAEAFSSECRIAVKDIPNLPHPRVVGHPGTMILGRLGRHGAILFTGRVHFYEGWSPRQVVAYVNLAARLGGRIFLVTNAAGGVSPLLDPGDLMLLSNQINLTFRNVPGARRGRSCLANEADDGSPFDPHLRDRMLEAAQQEKINLKTGVYGGSVGPMYETRAESAMWHEFGADAVGMSTVAEVAAARRVGMRVVGVSCIANRVPRWGVSHAVTHAEVVERVGRAGERLKRLISRWGRLIDHDAIG